MRMSQPQVVVTILMTLMFRAGILGAEETPGEIIEKTVAAYASLQTYKAEGKITTEIDSGGMQAKISTSFSILLKKPNLYRITWDQENALAPGLAQSGAVWSDGTQRYLYLGAMNAYSVMNSDELALGGATGISGGAAFTVPTLFLSVWKEARDPFSRLRDPILEQSEMIGDEDYHVLSGASVISKKETFWISKANFLIRKYRRSLEPPEGGLQMPDMSDEKIVKALQATGQEVTEARKKELREMMEAAAKMLKGLKMKGASTELHAVVASPELSGEDFAFIPPKAAVLKGNLFDDLVERTKALSDARADADTHSLALAGGELTTEAVAALEQQIEQNPDDVTARTKLLGYYFAKPPGEARRTHALWFIRNKPEHEINALPYAGLDAREDAEAYSQGKSAWIGHLTREPDNLKLLEHSARYFLRCDQKLARESLEKAQSLDGANPKWRVELGHLFSLEMFAKSGAVDAGVAAKALEHYEAAYNLSAGMEKDLLLKELATAALAAGSLAKAREYAEAMLDRNKAGWNYGNNIHQGNLVLGRIALLADNIEEAKKRLTEAGKTPGSPQLGSFGPNMSLAKELLEKGEKSIVLGYFELCSKFWKSGKDHLDTWSAAVRDGKMPDFGPNLRY